MSVENQPALPLHVSTDHSSEPERLPSFEERWTAWQARGAAHDRDVRRRLTMAAPIVAAVVATMVATMYVLFAR